VPIDIGWSYLKNENNLVFKQIDRLIFLKTLLLYQVDT